MNDRIIYGVLFIIIVCCAWWVHTVLKKREKEK